ncbi:MAG: class I SAM-dependent methyltransferase [Bacteroidota bacterium]
MQKYHKYCQTLFEAWFNSPYYHILYQNRDKAEAGFFIDNMCRHLNIERNSKILDVACGRGRHAIYLSQKGFDVTGIDISPQNIRYAYKFRKNNLSFYKHDMREPLIIKPNPKVSSDKSIGLNSFDYIMNLFTSFGYFENDEENQMTINSIFKSLKLDGYLIMDFMNSKKVLDNLLSKETRSIDGIEFDISRFVSPDRFIIKQIKIKDKGKSHSFIERVKALTLNDFEKYFDACGLKIVNLFGDYTLAEFNEKKSERLIMVSKKVKNIVTQID